MKFLQIHFDVLLPPFVYIHQKNAMRTLAVLIVCVIALSACSPTAQLVTLRGNNVKLAPDGLVLDTDTLMLRYNFSSERGQMFLSVVNKLDRPLYIDWKRSAFIIGQDKVDYWRDVATVDLSSSAYGSRYSRYFIGSINGTISKDEPVGFLPPKTRLDKRQFVIVPLGTLQLSGTPAIEQQKDYWHPGRKKPLLVNVYNYTATQSPLQFRNYLTLSTDKDFKTEFVIDTKFWASDVRVLPKDFITGIVIQQYDGSYSNPNPFDKPDGFYIPVPMQ